jgi:hypothetical protein
MKRMTCNSVKVTVIRPANKLDRQKRHGSDILDLHDNPWTLAALELQVDQ